MSSASVLTFLPAGGCLTANSALLRNDLLPPTPPPGATVCDDLRGVCLPTANCRLKTPSVRVTLRLAVYRHSFRLGAKPLEAGDQSFLFPTDPMR
jgi:hypothetical protein